MVHRHIVPCLRGFPRQVSRSVVYLRRIPIDDRHPWCHDGTMKRMNLRDVPDDVYAALAGAAAAHRQSLSAFVVERLAEVAQVTQLDGYLASYQPPEGSGVTIEDAAAAVREVREAS